MSSRFASNFSDDFIRDKFEKYIKSDFAHLTDNIKEDILADEYVCQTASEEGEKYAV